MGTFGWEVNKMMLRRGGWAIIAVSLLLELALLAVTDSPANTDAALYRADYLYYLEQVEGACTEEAGAFLEAEAATMTEAETALDSLYTSYYAGEISQEELGQQAAVYQQALERENGFDVIYTQYAYILQDMENRYFVETNGWAGLLGDDSLDLILIATLLLLLAPVFCGEYACHMDTLAMTARNGQRNFLWNKLLLSLLTAAGLCLAGLALRWGFYALRYGLPHGEYPFQSVTAFGGSEKALSLLEAFGLLAASRLFGTLYLTMLILCLSVLTRQYAATAFVSIASLLLPWAALGEEAQYSCPLPLPFLLGAGFLKGSESTTDYTSGEVTYTFYERTWENFLPVAAAALVLRVVCGWVIWLKNHTALSRRSKGRQAGVIAAVMLLCILSGCGNTAAEAETEICYNSSSLSYSYETYSVAFNDDFEYEITDSETGETFLLNHDALRSLGSGLQNGYVYGVGRYVYYVWETDSADATSIALLRVDLETLEERVVYEAVIQSEALGISLDTDTEALFFWQMIDRFVVDEDYVYDFGSMTRLALDTGEITELPLSGVGNVAYDGTWFYYKNDRSLLCRYQVKTGETEEWSDLAVADFCLAGDTIYYIDLRENCCLYAAEKDGTDARPVLEETGLMSVSWDGTTLTVVDSRGESQTVTPE